MCTALSNQEVHENPVGLKLNETLQFPVYADDANAMEQTQNTTIRQTGARKLY